LARARRFVAAREALVFLDTVLLLLDLRGPVFGASWPARAASCVLAAPAFVSPALRFAQYLFIRRLTSRRAAGLIRRRLGASATEVDRDDPSTTALTAAIR